MKKTLVIALLFTSIFLSACSQQTKSQLNWDKQNINSDSDFGVSCSLNSTWASDCSTDTWKLFSITSTAFTGWEKIPAKYSCMWKNINPSFEILNVPKWTQSFAMIAHDPDAPSWDWIHWIIRNFSPNTTKIDEWKNPLWSIVGKNSRWKAEYRWPCPPNGTHKYFFKLYAIDTNYWDLPNNMTLKQFEDITKWHVLWTTEIYWTYSK